MLSAHRVSFHQVNHDVQHFIETDGQPVASKYRQLDPFKMAVV
jgi:hypothetical protein